MRGLFPASVGEVSRIDIIAEAIALRAVRLIGRLARRTQPIVSERTKSVERYGDVHCKTERPELLLPCS